MSRLLPNQPLRVALLALAAWLAWTIADVHYNRQGNWTALFLTGDRVKPPAALAAENIYTFTGNGYDGQMYHYIAHDPFFRRNHVAYLDNPRYRYSRILVPLLAWILAAGNDAFIDRAYYSVIFLSLFLGTWWLSQWCVQRGQDAAWGLLFALGPAAVISLSRMTVDIAMAALTIAVALFAERRNWPATGIVIALACLCRETGLLLLASVLLYHFFIDRDIRRGLAMSLAILPAAAWRRFENQHTMPYSLDPPSLLPLYSWTVRILTPQHYPLPPLLNTVANVLDTIALLAIPALLYYAVRNAAGLLRSTTGLLIAVHVPLVLFLNFQDIWTEPIAWGRVFGPLFLLVAVDGIAAGRYWGLAPLSLCSFRVLLYFVTPALSVLRGILGLA